MNRIARIAAVIALFALAAVNLAAPVLAAESGDHFWAVAGTVSNQDGHGDEGGAGGETVGDVVPRVTWMLIGVAASAVVLSVLYLLKRRVGGFPKNPTWVAPITIMPSSQLPGDRDPHEAGSDDGHHPAHAAGH